MKHNTTHFLSHNKISPVSKCIAPNAYLFKERNTERKKEEREEERWKERTQIIVFSTQVNKKKKM